MSYFCMEEDTKLEVLEPGSCSRRIKKYDGHLMVVEVYMENQSISEPHVHPHEQMTYCLEGEFVFHIGEETKSMKPGDTVFMPPNILHNCELKTQKGRLLDIFTPIREDFVETTAK